MLLEHIINILLNYFLIFGFELSYFSVAPLGVYGAAWERPAETVQDDVREGYVSRAAAYDHYGVVLDPTTLAIDGPATAALRAVLAAGA